MGWLQRGSFLREQALFLEFVFAGEKKKNILPIHLFYLIFCMCSIPQYDTLKYEQQCSMDCLGIIISSITITISMFEAQRWSKFISAHSSMLSPAWQEGRGRSLKQLLTSRSQA